MLRGRGADYTVMLDSRWKTPTALLNGEHGDALALFPPRSSSSGRDGTARAHPLEQRTQRGEDACYSVDFESTRMRSRRRSSSPPRGRGSIARGVSAPHARFPPHHASPALPISRVEALALRADPTARPAARTSLRATQSKIFVPAAVSVRSAVLPPGLTCQAVYWLVCGTTPRRQGPATGACGCAARRRFFHRIRPSGEPVRASYTSFPDHHLDPSKLHTLVNLAQHAPAAAALPDAAVRPRLAHLVGAGANARPITISRSEALINSEEARLLNNGQRVPRRISESLQRSIAFAGHDREHCPSQTTLRAAGTTNRPSRIRGSAIESHCRCSSMVAKMPLPSHESPGNAAESGHAKAGFLPPAD
ncbi:hypothetical protein AURDEDRAFT_164441 [Auricularia subglabra TFB-10046 SS5]|nr:hypothetical protein AURDEDRAFT_164441 [Auricularia subglabra TFB-10046 SS5]